MRFMCDYSIPMMYVCLSNTSRKVQYEYLGAVPAEVTSFTEDMGTAQWPVIDWP